MAKKKKYKPANLKRIKTRSLKGRQTKVSVTQFASLPEPDATFGEFLESLPDILAASDLTRLIEDMVMAKRKGRPIVVALGAHIVKCGLGPVLGDLMRRGFITAVAMHGATAIHDYEISLIGATSEDVGAALKDGSFGMARETPKAFARAAKAAAKNKTGLGASVGQLILAEKNKFSHSSILATAAELQLPAAVMLALGTDTISVHADFEAEKLAAASHLDFRTLVSVVADLDGGVWLNIGSAVILHEVFLKALTAARNLNDGAPKDFTTANLDMIQHYRPNTNVVGRPTKRGYSITGHHEIMLPLLRMGVICMREEKS